ncbi:LOW QUALITY PROTEIN: GDT1-like protein 4 isoform X1 [Populus alba x Populus x berolinensis]|uniref:GDT1 family protein n=1 Tax=Populus alba x Populus x berolinensis TaxID=444605 RepID=A0AAD6L839_9ROSI|nr:LOW QUALITY PROTEIN: GDT1-like protein 4 isoform X1 [Populus alba x Populus x berolinensis]
MGFRSNPRFIILVVAAAVFLLLLSLSRIAAAQENEGDESRSFQDLGRRGMVVVRNGGDAKSAGNDLKLESGLGIFDAFFASLSMILVSEIGDETFIIAALMAMRHPKSTVLSVSTSAKEPLPSPILFSLSLFPFFLLTLQGIEWNGPASNYTELFLFSMLVKLKAVVHVLSTGLGRIVPNLISRKHTNSAATVLYAFFGLRLLYIAWRSDSKSSQKKEMEEVEEKLEAGQGKTSFRRYFSRFCTPIFLESFILTFLAEWGDRSQIATIALATHKNAIGVAVGATLGHTICTSLAVVGGSILASKISQGTVATIGGLLFLCFSLSSYFYPPL